MKKTLVSLFLALVMLVSLIPASLAEELPTLTVMLISNGRVHDPELASIKKIEENIGARLDVTMANDDVLNLSIAAGELADIICINNMGYAEFVSTGYLLPLNDLIAEHAPTIQAQSSALGVQLCSIDGVQYAIPHENDNSKYFTYLRKDWLENLGYDLSKYPIIPNSQDPALPGSEIYQITTDEYAKMLEDFTFGDPDGNGKNDTYGFSTNGRTADKMFMGFFGAFGGQMTQSYVQDGATAAFETTDDYRAALEYMNGLWKKGVIDPEIFILSSSGDQAKANLSNGKSGSFMGWWSDAYTLIRDGMSNLQPTVEWLTVELVGPDGKAGMRDNGLISNTISISSACKDPVLAIKVLDKFNEYENWLLCRYGIEGEHYTLDKENLPSRTEAGQKLFEGMTMDALYPLFVHEPAVNPMPEDPQLLVRLGMLSHCWVKDFKLYTSLFYGLPQTQESMDYQADVDSCVQTHLMQFVTGQKELNDATWAEYLKSWSSMGGSDILKSYTDAYNTQNGTSLVPAM